MKNKIILLLLLFVSCEQKNYDSPIIAQWIENAMNTDSIDIISENVCYAGEEHFHLRGMTLEQVEHLYGKNVSITSDDLGCLIDSRIAADDMSDICLSMFDDSDFPIRIITPIWERGDVVLQVDFVRYKNKWIVFDSSQYPKELLGFE